MLLLRDLSAPVAVAARALVMEGVAELSSLPITPLLVLPHAVTAALFVIFMVLVMTAPVVVAALWRSRSPLPAPVPLVFTPRCPLTPLASRGP